MGLANTRGSWGAIAKAFHWVIALLVFCMIALGWYAELLPRSPEKLEFFALHKATGVLILGFMVLRLLWRLVNPTPILPPSLKGWEKAAAIGTHWLLYLVVFLMPISGYVLNSAKNFPFTFFGLFPVPLLVGRDRELAHLMEGVHEWTSWALIGLLALHILAALRHHFILRDEVLRRMLPGRQ